MIVPCPQFSGTQVYAGSVPGCPSTGWTFAAWMKPIAGDLRTIISRTTEPYIKLRLNTVSGSAANLLLTWRAANGAQATAATPAGYVPFDAPSHIAVAFASNGTVMIYKNGGSVISVPSTVGVSSTWNPVITTIGAEDSAGFRGFTGALSHLCFFTPLTDAQILQLARVPFSYRYDAALLSKLIAAYPMDEAAGDTIRAYTNQGGLFLPDASKNFTAPAGKAAPWDTINLPTPNIPPALLRRRVV